MRVPSLVLALAVAAVPALHAASQQEPLPPPLPFPRSGGGPPPSPPAPARPEPAPAPAPATPAPLSAAVPAVPAPGGAPTDATLGVPGIVYGGSEFLESIELGRGQRAYLFGTNAGYAELVAYYKQVLKDGGRELFRAPAMQQFDLGRFQDDTMSTQPAVVVKDYGVGEGYLHVDGTEAKRFKTIIQIVPVTRP